MCNECRIDHEIYCTHKEKISFKSYIGVMKMAMFKSKMFQRVSTIFFALTFMISLFNMAVFPGTSASYYVVLMSKILVISLFNGMFFGTVFYLIVAFINVLIAKNDNRNQ